MYQWPLGVNEYGHYDPGMRHRAAGLTPVISLDRTSPRPLYRQLCDAYREAIAEHRLRGGERLPSTRTLAAELGISRVPVMTAFDQLVAEGYFETRRGSGTYVTRTLAQNTPVGKTPDAGTIRRASPPLIQSW